MRAVDGALSTLILLTRGLVLGLVAGVPLGPASASVFDTAVRKSFRRACAIGAGAAFVDFLYCLLVSAGLGAAFADRPLLSDVFILIGGVALVAFGIHTMRAPPIEPARLGTRAPVTGRTLLASFRTGALIALMNPGLLVSWVLMAGTVLGGLDAVDALIAASGVFVGTLAWFVVIAALAYKGRFSLGHRAVWITRIAGVLLVGYGAFLVGRLGVAWAFGRG